MTTTTILKETNKQCWTEIEIAQQPSTLSETFKLIEKNRAQLEAFIKPLITQKDLRIILTGAGTSAFIGECLAPWLSSRLPCRVEAIATTDIVAAPKLYLEKNTPTLLVSFGRSGNSPESVAAVDIANNYIAKCHQLAITCNAEGELAKSFRDSPNSLAFLLPSATHDRSFAMTSSFSAMMLAALIILSNGEDFSSRIPAITASVEAVLEQTERTLRPLSVAGFERAVFLGSHIFNGLARESALKLLELTDGDVVAIHDSPLGFRHGPKTIMTPKTLMVVMMSNDPLARKYDADLVEELKSDSRMGHLLLLDTQAGSNSSRVTHLNVPKMEKAQDVDLVFPYIAAAQSLALEISLARGMTPDQPSRFGNVNRVVQGVQIHEFNYGK